MLTVEPGEIRTSVLASSGSAYRVRLRIRAFSDAEWEVVLDAIAAQLGHAAALLDGELPPGIVDDARRRRPDLLPGAGEVGTSCSCPDWANPCKHAAAVCYLVADRLDEDPFELLCYEAATATPSWPACALAGPPRHGPVRATVRLVTVGAPATRG